MKDLLLGESDGKLNVHSRSHDKRARLLSALANRPFEVNGQMFSSVEGFFQGIRFPFDDPRRARAFASCFGYAREFRHHADENWIWWDGEKIPAGSLQYKQIIEMGFRESFGQNPDRMQALKNTRGLELTHNIGEEDLPNSPFTQGEFCKLLTKIRDEIV